MAAGRPVLHLPIAAALCTGVYAVSLASVTALQYQAEAAAARERAPLVNAAARAAAARAAALASFQQANDALQAATERYLAAVAASDELDATLSALAAQVAAVSGAAAQLPSSVTLPGASGRVAAAAPPPTHATTGASGKK